jgi:hypothetical protein
MIRTTGLRKSICAVFCRDPAVAVPCLMLAYTTVTMPCVDTCTRLAAHHRTRSSVALRVERPLVVGILPFFCPFVDCFSPM